MIMRAKDLSIGNTVYDSFIKEIVNIDLDILHHISVDESLYKSKTHRYQQIQIDEVHLSILGLLPQGVTFHIENDTNRFEFFINHMKHEIYLTCLGVEIRYLHELQNFHKILTGKELIFKI